MCPVTAAARTATRDILQAHSPAANDTSAIFHDTRAILVLELILVLVFILF